MLDFPRAQWVSLRAPDGRFIGRFDPKRGIIEIILRGESIVFDLAQMVSDAQAPPQKTILNTQYHPSASTG